MHYTYHGTVQAVGTCRWNCCQKRKCGRKFRVSFGRASFFFLNSLYWRNTSVYVSITRTCYCRLYLHACCSFIIYGSDKCIYTQSPRQRGIQPVTPTSQEKPRLRVHFPPQSKQTSKPLINSEHFHIYLYICLGKRRCYIESVSKQEILSWESVKGIEGCESAERTPRIRDQSRRLLSYPRRVISYSGLFLVALGGIRGKGRSVVAVRKQLTRTQYSQDLHTDGGFFRVGCFMAYLLYYVQV